MYLMQAWEACQRHPRCAAGVEKEKGCENVAYRFYSFFLCKKMFINVYKRLFSYLVVMVIDGNVPE